MFALSVRLWHLTPVFSFRFANKRSENSPIWMWQLRLAFQDLRISESGEVPVPGWKLRLGCPFRGGSESFPLGHRLVTSRTFPRLYWRAYLFKRLRRSSLHHLQRLQHDSGPKAHSRRPSPAWSVFVHEISARAEASDSPLPLRDLANQRLSLPESRQADAPPSTPSAHHHTCRSISRRIRRKWLSPTPSKRLPT